MELGDPLINDYHAIFLGAATKEELDEMYALTNKINELLKELFDKMNIILVDFKIELEKHLMVKLFSQTKFLQILADFGIKIP